ncbi:hypothetical protein PG994_000437 [Apiospora phragmitis]|uniref:DUF202 domain-containing protein n=1 Tax=Apiospora phragmitis TaxID=2905665 RepID=A0ABR1X6G8_9PEZI
MQRVSWQDGNADEDGTTSRPSRCCGGALSPSKLGKPIEYPRDLVPSENPFWSWPFLGPLLLENESSDARDHCANERTFLSYLRLSIYMAILSVAIVVSFHLRSQPSALELRIAKPLGIIFWILAFACLMVGFGNYTSSYIHPPCPGLLQTVDDLPETVNKYANRTAIVQSGWITQTVSFHSRIGESKRGHAANTLQIMSLVALSIIGTCVVLLIITKVQVDE